MPTSHEQVADDAHAPPAATNEGGDRTVMTGRKLKAIRNQQVAREHRGTCGPDGKPEIPPLCEEFAARRAKSGPAVSTLPSDMLAERIRQYDAEQHPLVELIAVAVGASSSSAMGDLHLEGRSKAFLGAGKKLGTTPVDRSFKASGGCRFNPQLRACYLRFLREVIMPLVPDPQGILYQREPNIRCHYPSTGRQLVLRHCDADYHHQPNEINFWVPCTSSYGTNTLWTESEPGRGDYHPCELSVGQFLQFYGHQCDHFTFPNDTPHTRISIDFRVVPRSHFLEHYENSHHPDGRPRFGVDAFFGVLPPLLGVHMGVLDDIV